MKTETKSRLKTIAKNTALVASGAFVGAAGLVVGFLYLYGKAWDS